MTNKVQKTKNQIWHLGFDIRLTSELKHLNFYFGHLFGI